VSQTPSGYWAAFRYTSSGLAHRTLISYPVPAPPGVIIAPPQPGQPVPDKGENQVYVGDTPVAARQPGAGQNNGWTANFADRQVGNSPADHFVVFFAWFPTGSSATWTLRLPGAPAAASATADASSPRCPLYNAPWGDPGTPGWPNRVGYERIVTEWPTGYVIVPGPGERFYNLQLPRSYKAGTKVMVYSLRQKETATPSLVLTHHPVPGSQRKMYPWTYVKPGHKVRLDITPAGRFTLVVRAKGHKNLRIKLTRIPPSWDPDVF
jgi:hypothetical protein